ncbi:hypothetical protein NKL07_21970 [Mesorhizobium sp. C280B]|uniref:hypothetical protein n=1 Tax=unclassified Mesorhizobium TaxID=325217 RepID=UPI0003CEEED3|nr:hypothetical protein [Mesorhizobium sp. LSJC280B00]ESW92946.1 hypothetical protein X772_03070 [Mesorhizobium sp. LSJC280B00]
MAVRDIERRWRGMRMISWGFRILVNALAWIGLLAVIAVALAFAIGPDWCEGSGCTVQGWFSALSGWAAAIAAGATIGILYKQARGGDHALAVAQETLAHARENSERQLRAYLFVVSAKVETNDRPQVPVQIAVRNTGQTPAYDVQFGCQRVAGRQEQILFSDPETKRTVDLGPGEGQVMTVQFDGAFLQQHRDEFFSEQFKAFTNIKYRDAFGFERETRFRLQIHPSIIPTGGDLDVCAEGNSAT